MIRLIVRYTVAAALAIVGGYFVLRAYTEMTAGILDVEASPPRNWDPLVLVLLFWGLAALVEFLPEFIPGQGCEALLRKRRCRQLGKEIVQLPRGEAVRPEGNDPHSRAAGDGRRILRPAEEDPRVVLCELAVRESGARTLLRYLDLQAKRRGIPARTPEVILYTDTEAHHVSEAWAEADARDVDRALEEVNIKRLLMDITPTQAMVLARDIRAVRETSVAK